MKIRLGILAYGSIVLLCLAAPATAQYLRITTDNPTDNTRLRASGTTILTLTLDTNHDKNGSLQSCNSHTAANCASATTTQPLDMFSYTLALKTVGGTVTWGTFTAADAAYTDTSPQIQSNVEVEINKARPVGTVTPAGLTTLGTIPVTPASGAPGIYVQIGASAINPSGFGTGFGTSCDGFFFPNTYVVGDPSDPCGAGNGIAGDWFDWDGVLSNGGDDFNQPVISAPSAVSRAEGTTFSVTATASDGDPGDILTITATGIPPFGTFSTIVKPSPTTATIDFAPGFGDAGTYTIQWTVNDGHPGGTASTITNLTITNTDRGPVLDPIANMTFCAGSTADQAIRATDADADAITFTFTGPTFMSVTSNAQAGTVRTGNIHLAPSFATTGSFSGSVTASSGSPALSDSKSFVILITGSCGPPVLAQPANMTVPEGGTADQTLNATDPGGSPITFSKVTGPTFMTVTTTNRGTGTATGNIHLAPGFASAGVYNATVRASNGLLVSDRTLTITVCNGCARAPVLNPIANMTVNEGATTNQALSATDADGQALTFTKASGPTYATVTTTTPGTGTAAGNLALTPGFSDAGTATVTISVSDGATSDSKSLTVTVNNVDRPVSLAAINNMTVAAGSTADQAFTATDPDGDAITFTHTGPAFMTRMDNAQSGTTRTGNIHLAPSSTNSGTFGASVTAAANGATSTRSFTILVCLGCERAPVLAQPANMTVLEGSAADQAIVATDPDGNALTFFAASGPSFMAVTTTNPGTGTGTGNIRLAPGFSDQGTYRATVTASDGTLTDSKSFSITVTDFCRAPLLAQPANMTVIAGSTADQTFTATDPDGSAITFTSSGPTFMTRTDNPQSGATRTGNIHLAPSPTTTSGTFAASVTATVGGACPGSDSKSFTITVCPSGPPPLLAQPANMSVDEGATADQILHATDPDGDPLTFTQVSGPTFMTVTTTSTGTGTATGNVHLAPDFHTMGIYGASIAVSDGNLCGTDTKSFSITVRSGNRCPTANAGGPYSGLAGVPVNFDGTASSDPDGNPLTYAWDFDASDGITVDGVGGMVSHVYATAGTFTVTLTVTDNGGGNPAQVCSNSATTTATIAAACGAIVFNGYDTIRLGSGKPFWFAYVQPATGCYNNSDVVIASFVMKYAGRQISASGKTAIGGDKSGDGIQEIKISFSKDDLRTLFTGTGLANGHNLVTVTLEASLTGGGKLSGTTQLDVVNNGSFNVAVSPNPMNPQATLTWTTSRAGFARIEMFDVQGRLVRRLVDEASMAAGAHEATIDGRNQRGESLPSGIYFIRGTLAEGEFREIITILK